MIDNTLMKQAIKELEARQDMNRHEWGEEEIVLHIRKWKKCKRCGILGSAQLVYDSSIGPIREVLYAFSLTLLSRGEFASIRPDCIEKQTSFSF